MKKRYERYSEEEKKHLIMECRQSGLSDYQWCHKNGNNNSTLYNWVKNLRNTACKDTAIEQVPHQTVTSSRQDVVKLNILPMEEASFAINPPRHFSTAESASIELNFNGCSIKIHNGADPVLLAHTIHLLRGGI